MDSPFLQQVLVWDAPTRVFHWLMAACFAGAWASAQREGWHIVHATLGWTMAGLVAFRIVWGFAGTRYARFASFVRGPGAVVRSLRDLRDGSAKRHIGHSPLGAVALIALLLLTLLLAASGLASERDPAAPWLHRLHEGAAHAMLVLAGLHITAMVFVSWRAGENLLLSIFCGTKLGVPGEAIRSARGGVARLLVAAVLGFWWYQWRAADPPEQPAPAARVLRPPVG